MIQFFRQYIIESYGRSKVDDQRNCRLTCQNTVFTVCASAALCRQNIAVLLPIKEKYCLPYSKPPETFSWSTYCCKWKMLALVSKQCCQRIFSRIHLNLKMIMHFTHIIISDTNYTQRKTWPNPKMLLI